MKKTFRTVALMMVLSTLAVSCQKETLVEPEVVGSQVNNVQTMVYYVDGVERRITLHNEAEWDAFMAWMLALTREGREVSFFNPETTDGTVSSKEVVTYKTPSEEDANKWATNMVAEGYTVTIVYDTKNHEYVCTAIK